MKAFIQVSLFVSLCALSAFGRDKLCLNDIRSRVFPLSPLLQTETLRLDLDNECRPRHPDKKMVYACRFSNLEFQDADCSRLPGDVSFNQRTGIFSWKPGPNAYGAFFFEVFGSFKKRTDSETFVVDVQAPYPLVGLRADFDADFATGIAPANSGLNVWKETDGNSQAAIESLSNVWSLSPPMPWMGFSPSVGLNFGDAFTGSNVAVHAWVGLKRSQNPDALLWSQGDFRAYLHSNRGYHLRVTGNISYPVNILSQAPMAYWSMSPSASGIRDRTFNGHDLMGGAGLEWVEGGVSNEAMDMFARFSSGDDALEISGNLMPGDQPVSVEAWVRMNSGDRGAIVNSVACSASGNCARVLMDVLSSGAPRWYLRDSAGRTLSIVSSVSVVDGNWHHVVGTYDRQEALLYVDGNKVARGAAILSAISGTQSNFMMGSLEDGSMALSGDIDEIAVYASALTGDTIRSHTDRHWGCVTPAVISSEGWHLLSVVSDGTQTSAFIDGNFQCSVNAVTASGNWHWGQGWNGGLSTVRIYNSADANSVAEYYQQTAPRYATVPWNGGDGVPVSTPDPVLTIVKSGEGMVSSATGEIQCGDFCAASYARGASATLTAQSSSDYVFVGWSGSSCLGADTCTVRMDQDHTVDAIFERRLYTLSVVTSGNGTVVSEPTGIDCGTQCSQTFSITSPITLRAIANPGSSFAGWIGGECGVSETCSVTMTGDTHVIAMFHYKLSIVKAGNGIITASVGDVNCGTQCQAYYVPDTSVTLSATAIGDSIFGGWGGGLCSGTGTCTVTMSSASLVFATFLVSHYPMTITKYGTGRIYSSPAGIDCGSTCSAEFDRGTLVTLTAQAAPGESFSGWGGGYCSGTGSCTVEMNQITNIVATFSLPITFVKIGTGNIVSTPEGLDCPESVCQKMVPVGTQITLHAVPGAQAEFGGWGGGWCGGTGDCTFILQYPVTVFATFLEPTYPMNISKSGEGTVTSSPAGISCGSTCQYVFDRGTQVQLSATPAPGYVFTGWGGGWCSGTGACSIPMNQITWVFATFTAQ